jgi:hypothetical protein
LDSFGDLLSVFRSACSVSGDESPPRMLFIFIPLSFTNRQVVAVNGNLGAIDGFRFIVPVGPAKSHSNPSAVGVVPDDRSLKHPLELELDRLLA